MEVLVTYDVATDRVEGRRRLRRVAQVCKNYGQRVQKSVFECLVNQAQYEQLVRDLVHYIDEKEDNLRIYRLREPTEKHCKHFGVNPSINSFGRVITETCGLKRERPPHNLRAEVRNDKPGTSGITRP